MLFAPKEKGQGLVEYALIIALIAILLIAALGLVTGALSTVFSRIRSAIRQYTKHQHHNLSIIIKKGEKAMLFAPKERGQGLVEYALIIALIAILLIAALGLVTGALSTVFSRIKSAIS